MGLLNQASDGLPSVLFALVRAVRHFGPLSEEELRARCSPTGATTDSGKQAGQTLLRWTQLGLFIRVGNRVELHPEIARAPHGGLAEVRGVTAVLRKLVLAPENNVELNIEGGALAADLTLALAWVLAQDTCAFPGGVHGLVWKVEEPQFGTAPFAFRNDTRWNGFRAWAPLLGFGWTEPSQGAHHLVVDPTFAVRDALSEIFGSNSELAVDEFLRRLAIALPVMDGGEYRHKVEERLVPSAWRMTRPHEISVSLSMALIRLDAAATIRLSTRADAPKRMLLGRGFRELQQVSHVLKGAAVNG